MTEEQIIRLYGKRCAEHCDDCCVCEVWAMHDLIETQAREIERLRGLVRGWHYLAVGPDEMGDYYTQKALIKASEPYASPALKAIAGDSHDQ